MQSTIIIPVRLNSSRLPNKPFLLINELPMIAHCFYRAAIAVGYNNTFIATCDKEISNYFRDINQNVIITSKKHKSALSRTIEASTKISKQIIKTNNKIIMLQGDEPLIEPNDL